jgi:hypothetical protein
VPAVLTLTVQNCATVTGFEPRTWRRKLVSLNVPHGKISGRTVCLAEDWTAAVARAIGRETPQAQPVESRERARLRIVAAIAGGRK